jgi:4'-phosphopantetheinyl transferase
VSMSSQETVWNAPPDNYSLPEGEVHVWRATVNWPGECIQELTQILSPDERERAARFHFDLDRRRYLVGRGVLRMLVGHSLGIPAVTVRFDYSAFGKPNVAAYGRPLQFNLSHSGELVLVAMTLGRAVGIDVERIRTDMAVDPIAAQFYSATESRTLSALPEHMRCDAFFACWTRKEAYLKASGDGLSLPLDQFEVSFLPGEQPRLLATLHDPTEAARWTLRQLDVGRGYKAAMAVEGSDWTLKCWDWPAHNSTAGRSGGIGGLRTPRFLSAN